MPKFNSYTALAANAVAADDLMVLRDTSVTTTKSVRMDILLEGLARVGSTIMAYDGTTVTFTATNIAVAGTSRVTSASATAFTVGRQGATNPSLLVDASVATNVTGISITGRATGAGSSIAAIGSGTNEKLTIDAKGTGTVDLNITGTGNVKIGTNLQMATAKHIADANGNELILFPATVASAVNEITVSNAATAGSPTISATGGDAAINLTLTPKGTGRVIVSSTTLSFPSAGIIADVNANELIKFPATVASAVNEITVTNAATAAAPSIAATGGDTNISLTLSPKGTAAVVEHTSLITEKRTVTSKTDNATLTIAELLTGIIGGDPTGAALYTLPTAALLVAGIANCKVGTSFSFLVNNIDAALTITLTHGSGGGSDGTLTVAPNVIRRFTIFVTNVTGASEAYTLYGEGA